MWVPYFNGGGTPKEILNKIKSMAASVSPGDRGLYEFISQWGWDACVASGPFAAEVHNSRVATTWGISLVGESSTIPGPMEGSVQSIAWQDLRPLLLL